MILGRALISIGDSLPVPLEELGQAPAFFFFASAAGMRTCWGVRPISAYFSK